MEQESHRAEADEKVEEVHEAHQSNENQVRHEPIPASHHDDRWPPGSRRDEDASGQDQDHGSPDLGR